MLTLLLPVTEQLEGMKVHADTALAAVTEQLEGMKVADERRVEVLTRRQEWREELTAQQVVVSLATRMQAAARGLLTRAALRRINTLVSPVRGKKDVWPLPQPCLRRPTARSESMAAPLLMSNWI